MNDRMYVCMYLSVYVYIYLCMYVSIYVSIYICCYNILNVMNVMNDRLLLPEALLCHMGRMVAV